MLRFRVIYKNINFTKFLRLIENGGEIMFTNKNNVGLKISFIIMLIATIVGFEKFIYPSLFNDKSPKTHAIEIGWTINNSSNISGYELYLNGKKVCAWRDWEKATLENTASTKSTREFYIALPRTNQGAINNSSPHGRFLFYVGFC